jgi:hypothetical protein
VAIRDVLAASASLSLGASINVGAVARRTQSASTGRAAEVAISCEREDMGFAVEMPLSLA